MKSVIRTVVIGLAFAGVVAVANAQVGKPVTIVDANAVTAAELAKLPHMTADRQRQSSPSVRSRRPRTSITRSAR